MRTYDPLLTLTLTLAASASPDLSKRACPALHIFGARETTAAPGYGSSHHVVDALLQAHPSATAEAITYPACGGQASCGGLAYAQSVAQGVSAVSTQVSSFAKQCPSTKIVVVGYSQGAEIFDNALCGSGQGSIAAFNIAAAIFMGDPRFQNGAPYNVGTCRAHGFDARPAGQTCGKFNSRIQSYCDAADPYCCTGGDAQAHNVYGQVYGAAATAFVNSKL